MSSSKVANARKVNVQVIGESPRLFSFCRSPLEKAGCHCHFAESHQEISKILGHIKVGGSLFLEMARTVLGQPPPSAQVNSLAFFAEIVKSVLTDGTLSRLSTI